MAPARGKLSALLGAALVAFASGALMPFVAEHGREAVAMMAVTSSTLALFALFAWIQFDRRERHVPRSPSFNLALAWFAVVAAPVYFVRHRARGQRWRPLLGLLLAATVGWNALLIGGIVAGGIARVLLGAAA
jgi:hypothetical protein